MHVKLVSKNINSLLVFLHGEDHSYSHLTEEDNSTAKVTGVAEITVLAKWQ